MPGLMDAISSPMGTLGTGLLRNFFQNIRRNKSLKANRGVTQNQINTAGDYYRRAIPANRERYAGLSQNFAGPIAGPQAVAAPQGARGVRRRADGSSPADYAVGKPATGDFAQPQVAPGQAVQNDYQALIDKITGKQSADQEKIVKMLTDRYDRNMASLQGLGQQAAADTNKYFDAGMGKIASNAAARGMSGSVVSNFEAGNEANRASEQNRLAEGLRRERIGLDTSLSKDVADAFDSQSRFGTTLAQMLGGQKVGNLEQQRREDLAIKQGAAGSEGALQEGGYRDIMALLESMKQPVDQYAPLLDAVPAAASAHINQRQTDSNPGFFGDMNPMSIPFLISAGVGATGIPGTSAQSTMMDLMLAQMLAGA